MCEYPDFFDLIPFEENSKWGYKNKNSDVIFQSQFDDEGIFPINGPYAIIRLNGLYGLIDMYGNFIFTPVYKKYSMDGIEIGTAYKGASPINFDGKFGFISWDKKIIIPPIFKKVKWFSENRAAVCQNGKWGFIDETGKLVIKHRFSEAREFKEGFAIVTLAESDTIYRTKFENYQYYIDAMGSVLKTEFEINNASDFSEGMAKVGVLKSIVEYNPHFFTKPSYEEIVENSFIKRPREKFIVVHHYSYGFINTKGELVIDLIYEDATNFKDGVAFVKSNEKWGIINKHGNLLVDAIYASIESFSSEYFIISDGDKYGVINNQGEVIVACQYDQILTPLFSDRRNGIIIVVANGKQGLVSLTEKREIITCKYDEIVYFHANRYKVTLGDNSYYIDQNDTIISQ